MPISPTRDRLDAWKRRAIFAPIVGSVIAASVAIGPAYAQDATPGATPEASPEASPAAETEATPAADQTPADVTTLFETQLAEFPASPVSIRLLRITLAPGASSPMHTHPGPEFDLVESGTLTVIPDGEATVTVDGESSTIPAEGADLTPGQLAVFPPGVGMNLVNNSEEDVVLLSAVFHPVNEEEPSTVYADGEPEADAFEGVSFTVLGDGIVLEASTGETTVVAEQIVVPAESDLPASDGPALYSVVDGNFSFTVDSGDVQVSRSAAPGLRPNAAPGQEFSLNTGDAAFFPSGVGATARPDETEPLTVLRLSATPAEAAAGEPAAVTFQTAAAESEPADGESVDSDGTSAASTELEVGATVVTNSDTVNVRAEPTTASDGIDQLALGIELEIIGGPESADDFTWWQVRIVSSDVEGWVVEDFISIEGAEEPAPEEEEAVADGTPEAEAEPAEDEETFAEGDIVVTNDSGVRIRDAANAGGNIVNAFDAGTEFTITGAAEEADGFTWYPVALVSDDSITGWVASDFIDIAPAEEEEAPE